MAHGSFSPDSFFARADGALLEQFAKKYGIPFTHDDKEPSQKTAERFFHAIESLPEDERIEVWGVLFDIDDMATEQAGDYLIEMAVDEGIKISQKEIDSLTTNQSRSLFFYLRYNDLFEASVEDVRIDNLSGWYRFPLVDRPVKDVVAKVSVLERELKKQYQKEYKGKHCKLVHYIRDDRLCITAFIEGMYTNDLAFEGKAGQFTRHKARKRVLEAFFVYRYRTGELNVKAKGGKDKVYLLQQLFSEYALGELIVFEDDVVTYDFEKFTRFDELNFEPSDDVDFVQLKALRLQHKQIKDQFHVQIGNRMEYGAQSIRETLGALGSHLSEYFVTQATIFVRFKKFQKETRTKKVTFQLTYPNRHNLKERPQDIKVRELLKLWGLDLLAS